MLLAALVVAAAIGLGIALALLPIKGNRGLGLLRTFALATSISVVAFHLLPEATSEIGWWAIGGAFATLALPGVLGHLFGKSHGTAPLTLELGYAGLLVHSASDGLALGRYGTGDATLGARLDVMLAVSAHTVPVVAVLVLVYAAKSGIGAGLLRALGLGVATMVGVAVAANSQLALSPIVDALIATVVSGLLLHIVAHGLEYDPPASLHGKAGDLLVGALGLGLGLWLERGAEHEGHAYGRALEDHALQLFVSSAPLFLLAMVAATVAELVFRRVLQSDPASDPARARGADVLVLSLALLGWRLTVLRLLPMLAEWLIAPPPRTRTEPPPGAAQPAWLNVSAEQGAALVGGVLLAAVAQAAPERAADSVAMNVGAALTVALVAHYSPLAATPLSAALLNLEVPPHWLVMGWCIGAFTLSLARTRVVLILAVEVLLGAVLVLATALLANELDVPSVRPLPIAVSAAIAGLLGLWLVCGVWQQGLRRWIWSAALGSGYAAGHGNGVQQDPAGRDPVSQSLRG